MKLPEAVKEKWLKALRSGDYEQGRENLIRVVERSDGCSYTEYCCLGVLETVCPADVDDLDRRLGMPTNKYWSLIGAKDVGVVPDELAVMNDGNDTDDDEDHVEPASFVEIADWIEKNIEAY